MLASVGVYGVIAFSVQQRTLVALFACWFPARRASRTDPLVAIRYD